MRGTPVWYLPRALRCLSQRFPQVWVLGTARPGRLPRAPGGWAKSTIDRYSDATGVRSLGSRWYTVPGGLRLMLMPGLEYPGHHPSRGCYVYSGYESDRYRRHVVGYMDWAHIFTGVFGYLGALGGSGKEVPAWPPRAHHRHVARRD
ncbi:hypothetical protein TIFTF001_038067 [Ficus carica]|uniref:Uncharacterized protein n=1 Tax=Ficus carica TaxID=3494 RepID=A0AA88JCH2_FICCA|nr:hypothetical protein TIFTF001_038067 [Ficus carica]